MKLRALTTFVASATLFSSGCIAKFTYDELITSPRRSDASLNADGSLAVYTASQYSFDSHDWRSTVNLLSLHDGSANVLLESIDIDEVAWAGTNTHTLLYLNGSSPYTSLWSVDVNSKSSKQLFAFPGSVSNLKVRSSPNGLRVAVSGWATPDGSLVSPDAPARPDSGLLYDDIFVRHWDYWLTDARNAVFGLFLSKDLSNVLEPLTNYISKTKLESPVMPFPSAGDFDLHDDFLVINSKAPELTPANNTVTYFYVIKYEEPQAPNNLTPLNKLGFGAASSPVFAPDGKRLAGLVQHENGYESDQNIVYVYDLNSDGSLKSYRNVTNGKQFDRSPSSVAWSPDETDVLYLTGGDVGKTVIWRLDLNSNNGPVKLSTTHSVQSFSFISGSSKKILLSLSSLTKSTYYEIYNSANDHATLLLESDSPSKLSSLQVGEFWFTGSREVQVHGFIIYPSEFDPKKKYPLAFLIHGGPQSAWEDSWSTRWNPAVWADNGKDGYVVVTINPTGSTTYGKDFTDKIANNWGSYPYIDLVLGLEYVVKTYEFIDTERMIAAGASYGGYMVNWIQGSALGRVFKALVTHDGVFSTLNQYASEELYFPNHDFGGSFLENIRGYYKYNPLNRIHKWATPHFIIHNAKDYRLPESEGLIAFNILQTKGVPSKLLHFPDENHWILKPENLRRWHKEIFEFINYWSKSTEASVEVIEQDTENKTFALLQSIADSVRGGIVVE
ncbi:Alpha/Beta hydrolase protein [Lipomyces japonicus]|uniref:Alpha/Beta hydrolase protein n=1 Tax=Lipomyces japonicus TaxID=56871 RepID=UPI0034CF3249